MIDNLSLGPVPSAERCEQVGPDYRPQAARQECRAFINQLKRTFPQWDETEIDFRIMSHSHDFGTYLDVAVLYDDNAAKQVSLAFHIEANTPDEWDADAIAELEAAGLSPRGCQ